MHSSSASSARIRLRLPPRERPTQPPQERQEEGDFYAGEGEAPFIVEEKIGGDDDAFEAPVSPPSTQVDLGPEVRVDTDLYTAVFATRGAVLKSLVLKQYLDQLGPEGEPVEMVSGKASGRFPLGLTLRGTESTHTEDILFTANKDSLSLTEGDSSGTIVFTGKTAEGMEVTKALTFRPDSYLISIDVDVIEPPGSDAIRGAIVSWLRVLDPEKDKPSRLGFTGPATYAGGKLHEIKIDKLEDEHMTFAEAVRWAKYVSAANEGKNPLVLATLASAYAEAADFDKAVETATRALEIAQGNGDQRLADELERRLELFQDQKPFRLSPRG